MNRSLSIIVALLYFALVSDSVCLGAEAPVGLADLPPEVARVFAETLVPNLGVCDTIDLDGDGVEEVVLFSGSPLAPGGSDSGSTTISFQSLLTIFRRESEESGGFPYLLSAKKTIVSSAPNPAHVTLADMGADPSPEIVWLEGGPDSKGRYSKAVLYSFRGVQNPSLVEIARFENPSGWVRVHDLDRDGVSEAIAFSDSEGSTVCPDLLFFLEDRWTSLLSEIRSMGFVDVAGFQTRLGLEPNGRVTRDLLLRFKSFRATGEIPTAPPASEESLGPIYE